MAAAQNSKHPDDRFAIILKKNKKLIGGCRLTALGKKENKKADMGCILHKDYWGQGYGTEVNEALLEYGFKKLKLHRILAMFRPEQKRSAGLVKKLGMRHEATLKKNTFHKGQWHDTIQYAMLEEEFLRKR